MTVPDIAALLPNLRSTILTRPAHAAARLRQLTAPATPRIDPAQVLDALGLLAETYLRLQRPDDAVRAAVVAGRAAQQLEPVDQRRVIVVHGIAADIAVRTGHRDAADMAVAYCTLIAEGDFGADNLAHQGRMLMATGLIAVELYRTDCVTGRAQLGSLHTTLAGLDWPAGLAVISRAVTAADRLCHGHQPTRSGSPPPMPGGLLHPDVHHPPADYLADRLTAHPPTHTHDQHPESITGPHPTDPPPAATAHPDRPRVGTSQGEPS